MNRARLWSALLFVCLFALQEVSGAEPRLFWKAESERGTVYLLGSLHFGESSMYPLAPMITDALRSSEVLAVEIDIATVPFETVAETFRSRGLYHDGERLSDYVDESTWIALTESAREYGLPLMLLERQKPWFASMTMTTLALARRGYRSDLGIDSHVMNLAAGRVPIVELESIERQVGLLDSLSNVAQAQMLEQTLEHLEKTEEYFQTMLESWRSGDASRLDELLIEEYQGNPGGDEIYRTLIAERNDAMEREILRLLEEHAVVFVVVGAGHMVGEDGIVASLGSDGFEVTQPGR